MPTFRPSPDLDMHYEVDDFTDPWRKPETILLLHGNAESGLAWCAWVEHLARANMANRLGSAFPAEGFDFWCKFMGRTALSTQLGFMGTIACADIRPDIPKIACPTLVVTTEESGLATVDATRAWQEQIAGSELVVLPGNSYHVAATHADQSAAATLEFIGRRGG